MDNTPVFELTIFVHTTEFNCSIAQVKALLFFKNKSEKIKIFVMNSNV